jgi:hypothetical protein
LLLGSALIGADNVEAVIGPLLRIPAAIAS